MFRYRLRTLLIVVTLFGIWLGFIVNSAQRQGRAVKTLNSLGICALYDFQVDADGNRIAVQTSPIPKWILDCTGPDLFHNVVVVQNVDLGEPIDSARVAHSALVAGTVIKQLSAFKRLKVLWLRNLHLNDELFKAVAQQHGLQKLALVPAPEVTDAGIRRLRDLSQLHSVAIGYSRITNDSLRSFGKISCLEELHLEG